MAKLSLLVLVMLAVGCKQPNSPSSVDSSPSTPPIPIIDTFEYRVAIVTVHGVYASVANYRDDARDTAQQLMEIRDTVNLQTRRGRTLGYSKASGPYTGDEESFWISRDSTRFRSITYYFRTESIPGATTSSRDAGWGFKNLPFGVDSMVLLHGYISLRNVTPEAADSAFNLWSAYSSTYTESHHGSSTSTSSGSSSLGIDSIAPDAYIEVWVRP